MNTYTSLSSIKHAIKANETNCFHLTTSYLQEIEKNKHLNAFIEVFAEEAIERAKVIDQKIANGTAGKLAGMVIGIKDNICYMHHPSFSYCFFIKVPYTFSSSTSIIHNIV